MVDDKSYIELGEAVKVNEFFTDYPEYINKIQSQHNWTPLMYACRYGNSDIFRILYKLGFVIDENTIQNLLHLTLYSRTTRIISDFLRIMSKDEKIKVTQQHLKDLLNYSAKLGKEDMVFFHIVNGAMVIRKSSKGREFLNCYDRNNCLYSCESEDLKFDLTQTQVTTPYFEIVDNNQDPNERSGSIQRKVSRAFSLAKTYKLDLICRLLQNSAGSLPNLPKRDVFKYLITQENDSVLNDIKTYLI